MLEARYTSQGSGSVGSKRIRQLLAELDRELHSAEELDDDTRELLQQLNDDIEVLSGMATGLGQVDGMEKGESPVLV